jgi:hypothetical protein
LTHKHQCKSHVKEIIKARGNFGLLLKIIEELRPFFGFEKDTELHQGRGSTFTVFSPETALNRQGHCVVTDNLVATSNCLDTVDETLGGYEMSRKLGCCPGLNWNACFLQGFEDQP